MFYASIHVCGKQPKKKKKIFLKVANSDSLSNNNLLLVSSASVLTLDQRLIILTSHNIEKQLLYNNLKNTIYQFMTIYFSHYLQVSVMGIQHC